MKINSFILSLEINILEVQNRKIKKSTLNVKPIEVLTCPYCLSLLQDSQCYRCHSKIHEESDYDFLEFMNDFKFFQENEGKDFE
jgi:hypothetical protein